MTAGALTVALVNSMPGPAAAATHRQFHSLLAAAFPGRAVHIRQLTCLKGPCAGLGGSADPYDALADGSALPDLVVVTGAEPVGGSLPDEPIWPGVTWLADWAASNGVPVVWSCLAAHAAVRHLDGIDRIRLPVKLSGVFVSKLADKSGVLAPGLPASFPMPQSRYHEVPERLLEHRDYRVLARSTVTGADVFTKHACGPFLFLQGHPEYEADTLMREYRRDMRQYLEHSRKAPPAVPHAYFRQPAEQALVALAERAAESRVSVTVAELNATLTEAAPSTAWQRPVARLIGGWLSGLASGVRTRADACSFDQSYAQGGAVA